MLEYIVHSCDEVKVATKAMLGDREVEANVPGLVVELVQAEDDPHGHADPHGHTFRLLPATDAELAKNRAMFAAGNRVRLSFAPVKGDA